MADAFGVTHRTLHFYEEKGLIHPTRSGSMRTYPTDQVTRMAFVTFCRETGMPVAQIQDLLSEMETATTQEQTEQIFRRALVERRAELAANQALVRRQMQQIAEYLADSVSDRGDEDSDERLPFLTEFENTCLALMAEGYTPVRIAAATRRNIDEILDVEASVIRKFGSSNRFQAVAKAVLLGLVGE
ncbi:MerR family transcriptional regulator [Rhizobium alvei]|uniref:MerR family transcriptional regulator n=1 Tax=Rhizobium alvei TaxID=1132659 RepID=A0ABT8YIA0_9HYPH|nr:MerR family transcriptional regulator [Rhizobium alvei]MDO6963424.1 MerR family transcriptional regulator [Rhizobium alvei]